MASPKEPPRSPGFFSKIRRQFSLAPSRNQGVQAAPETPPFLGQKEPLLYSDGKLNILFKYYINIIDIIILFTNKMRIVNFVVLSFSDTLPAKSQDVLNPQHKTNLPKLQPTAIAPEFSGQAVWNGKFKEISIKDYKGKYIVLLFYPADFTFVCPTELIAFSERAEEFRKEGCEIIAVSCDSEHNHLAWTKKSREAGGLGKMNIPLLSDRTQTIATKYRVLKSDEGNAFRGLFIIDGRQKLRQITVNDLPVGRDVEETLRVVQAFKFTDEHGDVCPAGWKKGKKGMKATPEGVSQYLASHIKGEN